jgi:pimeloyl-ACP methyl ester carboxylesterase
VSPAGLSWSNARVRSFDDTDIAARRVDGGAGAPLLIANAVGANTAAWRRTLGGIVAQRPALTWDHRGLLESGPPRTQRIDPGAHAEDAIAVLDHYGVAEVVIASWSNGTRIGLEIAHRYPERVRAIAFVCGAYGYPLGRVLRLEFVSLLPLAAGVAKQFPGLISAALRAFASRREVAGLIRQSGMVAATADTRALVELLKGIASCDMRLLLAIFEAVAGDAAPELGRSLTCPALVIAAERDQFTPQSLMQEMARLVPNASLIVYPNATHYLPLEHPVRLADDLSRLFDSV